MRSEESEEGEEGERGATERLFSLPGCWGVSSAPLEPFRVEPVRVASVARF